LPRSNPTKDKIRRIMSTVYTRAQKYGLVPRSDSSNPVRWVEQTAKSGYKPIVLEPATAAKIFEALSGAELALAILVAATGIRISEAMGLKWEDVDYQNKQINLRRVWVKDTIVERLKTEDSEAPVPLTDLLANSLRDWQRETVYGRPSDWVFASARNDLIGGPDRDRTDDLFHAMEARSQLRHRPTCGGMQLFYCLRETGQVKPRAMGMNKRDRSLESRAPLVYSKGSPRAEVAKLADAPA
jgi:integrase